MPVELQEQRTLRQRCLPIRLLVLDVDGVLTEGQIVYGDGQELKHFHVRDGSGLKQWSECGRLSALITGRNSPSVLTRARETGIAFVFQGISDKLAVYGSLLEQTGLNTDQVCYVGDDLPDVKVLRQCGLAVAVADACVEAREAAHHVTLRPGGRGAVREVIELILRCQDCWPIRA